MSIETQGLIEICEQLPEAKRAEVANFARFLLAQEGDAAWEKLIAAEHTRPKLRAFLCDAEVDPPR